MPISTGRLPGYPHFCPICLQIGDSPSPQFSGSIICYNGSQNSGKHYVLLLVYCRGCYKEHELPHEEVHRVRFGKVPSIGASVPVELGCSHIHQHVHIHQPGDSLNNFRVFMEILFLRHEWLHHCPLVTDSSSKLVGTLFLVFCSKKVLIWTFY